MIKLDPEQERIVQYPLSSICIAGPGSGKTRVLTAKAIHEIDSLPICLTFTRSAASEIRSRSRKIRASTIHSLCYHHVKTFTDYDDLLHSFLELKRKPKFEWVLVDEYQDLNPPELEVVKSIVGKHLFLVGDNCQAIFGYQEALGAKVEKYLEIKPKVFRLRNNYRSNQSIINRLEKIHERGLVPKPRGDIDGTAITFRTNHQLGVVYHTLSEMGYNPSVKLRGNRYPGAQINHGNGTNILLSTIHCLKGLEFRKVICWDWGEREQEPNLEYVAIARASEEFYLINSITELLKRLNDYRENRPSYVEIY